MKHLFTHLLLIFTLTLVACSKDITPTTGNIYGTVYDESGEGTICNALVTLLPIGNSVTTGSDGSYQFIDIVADKYTIQCSADGYTPRNKDIIIYAGSNNYCDIHLKKEPIIEGFSLSTNTLNFGSNESEKIFCIRNNGNAGDISWSIGTINVAWLNVDPSMGVTAQGQQSNVKVIIDRTKITKDESTNLIIEAGGGSKSIAIYVNSGKSNGDGNNNSGSTYEDYSSATISSCDDRVEAEIVSCKRNNSTVVFTYKLTNVGLGDVNDWRIYPTNSGSLISGGYRSLVYDNLGNEYFYSLFKFRNASNKENPVAAAFPEDMPCTGSVTVYNVDKSASTLTIMLGVFAYPDSKYNLADKRIYFNNVPIY